MRGLHASLSGLLAAQKFLLPRAYVQPHWPADSCLGHIRAGGGVKLPLIWV